MSKRVEPNQRTPFSANGLLTKFGVDLFNGLLYGQALGARWKVFTPEETTISVAGTFVKMDGVMVGSFASGFQVDDNSFTSSRNVTVDVDVILNLTHASGAVPGSVSGRIRVFRAKSSSYEDFNTGSAYVDMASTDTATVVIMDTISLLPGDRVEIWITNNLNTTNLTAEEGSYCRLRQI